MSRYFSEYLPFFGGVAIFNEICSPLPWRMEISWIFSWAPLCWSVSNLGNRIWNQVQKVDLLSCLAFGNGPANRGNIELGWISPKKRRIIHMKSSSSLPNPLGSWRSTKCDLLIWSFFGSEDQGYFCPIRSFGSALEWLLTRIYNNLRSLMNKTNTNELVLFGLYSFQSKNITAQTTGNNWRLVARNPPFIHDLRPAALKENLVKPTALKETGIRLGAPWGLLGFKWLRSRVRLGVQNWHRSNIHFGRNTSRHAFLHKRWRFPWRLSWDKTSFFFGTWCQCLCGWTEPLTLGFFIDEMKVFSLVDL